jgi:hypothetical protein
MHHALSSRKAFNPALQIVQRWDVGGLWARLFHTVSAIRGALWQMKFQT